MADDDDQMTRQRYRQSRETGAPGSESTTDDQPQDDSTSSRRAYAAETNRNLEEAKTKRLARKLNWVILGLVLGIIVVFLILFLTP